MFTRLFVQNPIFTNVIAIIAVILGIVSLTRLPIALYPDITPPTIDLPHQPTAYLEQADGRCHTDYALHGVFQHVDDAVLARIPEVVAQGFPTLKAYTTYDGRLDDEGLLQVLAALRDAGGLLAVHCENHAITRFLGDKLRREAPRDRSSG